MDTDMDMGRRGNKRAGLVRDKDKDKGKDKGKDRDSGV